MDEMCVQKARQPSKIHAKLAGRALNVPYTKGAIVKGDKVVLIDDLIATGQRDLAQFSGVKLKFQGVSLAPGKEGHFAQASSSCKPARLSKLSALRTLSFQLSSVLTSRLKLWNAAAW